MGRVLGKAATTNVPRRERNLSLANFHTSKWKRNLYLVRKMSFTHPFIKTKSCIEVIWVVQKDPVIPRKGEAVPAVDPHHLLHGKLLTLPSSGTPSRLLLYTFFVLVG